MAEDFEEVVEAVAENHGDSDEDSVALDSVEAAGSETFRVPIAFAEVYEGPH